MAVSKPRGSSVIIQNIIYGVARESGAFSQETTKAKRFYLKAQEEEIVNHTSYGSARESSGWQ